MEASSELGAITGRGAVYISPTSLGRRASYFSLSTHYPRSSFLDHRTFLLPSYILTPHPPSIIKMQPSIALAHSPGTLALPCDLSIDTVQHSPRGTSSLGTAQDALHPTTSLMAGSEASTDSVSPPIRSSSFSPPLAHGSDGSTASTRDLSRIVKQKRD